MTNSLYIKQIILTCLLLALVSIDAGKRVMAKSSLTTNQIRTLVVEEAVYWQVEPELALAVARIESNFDSDALSSAGARGVMQIMPATAKGEFGVDKYRLYEPHINIRIGVQYLKQLLERYHGDERIALSHYNGGSRVRKSDGTLAVIPATRKYVNKVLAQKAIYADHSLVLAAKQGGMQAKRIKLARAQLDDFGGFGYKAKHTANQHAQFDSSMRHIDAERTSLVRALRELKFRNNYRSVSNPSKHSIPREYLDDF